MHRPSPIEETDSAKEARREYYKEWARRNPDKIKAYAKRYRASHEKERFLYNKKWENSHRDIVNLRNGKRMKKWRFFHLEEARLRSRLWYQNHKATCNRWSASYKKTHPEVVRASNRNREALLRGSVLRHTAQDEVFLAEIQGGKCYYCGRDAGQSAHLDHMMSIKNGGDNSSGNICFSCPTCNTRKQAKSSEDFIKAERLPWHITRGMVDWWHNSISAGEIQCAG